MRKRFIAMALIALMFSAIFISCNKEGTAAKKTDLLLWMPPYGSGDTLDKDFWTRHLSSWAEEKNVNLSLEITPWDNYEEKYLTGLSSGTGPDVGYMYIDMLGQFLEMGALEPIEPYFTKEEQENYLYYNLGNIKGTQYLVPIIVGAARVLWFNMDLLERAGVTTLPKTWDDFTQMGIKINSANLGSDIMTFAQNWTGFYSDLQESYFPFLQQSGGRLFSDDGTRVTLMDNNGAVRAAQFTYDLMHVHHITSENSLFNLGSIPELFAQGKLACAWFSTGYVNTVEAGGINWDFVTSLRDERNKDEGIWIVADFLIINSASKQKQLAADLIKQMTSPSVMEAFHAELFPSPPISKQEAYKDHDKFRSLYSNIENMHMDPVAKNVFKVSDNLYRNLQQMMLGDMSPEQAIKETVDYANQLD
jgi:multiple sugar transport system substrate-binding protein